MPQESHSPAIVPISVARLLERFSYYGMRSILVLYMVNELQVTQENSSKIYAILFGAMGIVPIFGGLITDTLLGTRAATIAGFFTQALGCFVMVIPGTIPMYAGLVLIALGSGLSSPALLAMVTYSYKERVSKMDSAMTIFYFSVNLGAMIGSFAIMMMGEIAGFRVGFALAGLAVAGSGIVMLLSGKSFEEIPKQAGIWLQERKNDLTLSPVLVVVAMIALMGLFWRVYDFSSEPVIARMSDLDQMYPRFSYIYSMATAIPTLPVCIILAIIFSFWSASSFFRLLIGCIIFFFTILILHASQYISIGPAYLGVIGMGILIQAVAEIFIAPVVLSVIAQYSSLRFPATIFGAYFTIMALFSTLANYVFHPIYDLQPVFRLGISLLILLLMAAVFLAFWLLSRKPATDPPRPLS